MGYKIKDNFIKNGDTLQPLITDSFRWRYLIVDLKKNGYLKVLMYY